MRPYFEGIETIRHAGPDSTDPLAFRWYDADRVVGDRTMAEHLRMAVCYWHNFVWPGSDVFGEGTFGRPWHDESLEPMDAARHKLDVAFGLALRELAPSEHSHSVRRARLGTKIVRTQTDDVQA